MDVPRKQSLDATHKSPSYVSSIGTGTVNEVEMEEILDHVLLMDIDSENDGELQHVDIHTLDIHVGRSQNQLETDNNQDTDNETFATSHANDGPTTNVATPVNIEGEDNKENDYVHKNRTTRRIDTDHRIVFKWYKFLSHTEIIGRLLLFILNVLLLILSALYCMGQWYESTLDLVTRCEGQTIEDIWKHSYDLGIQQNGEIKMSPESHWGATGLIDPCWTTHKLSTNTDTLWYSNLYTSNSVRAPVNFESVAFGLLTVYCLYLIIYNIYTLFHDFRHASEKTLHKTSNMYKYFMEHQNKINTASQAPKSDTSFFQKTHCFNYIRELWTKYMSNDTTGWIVRGLISEIVEITIQTQALLLYNGYNVLDPQNQNNVYLANKSYFIVIFAAILAFNCIASGVLWLSYALITKYCHGLLFTFLLFWVDEFSDLFYTLFPFVVILSDEYNADKTDLRILLSQLNTESSAIAFISSFLPLFLLVSKSLFFIRSAKNELADKYYAHWKFAHDLAQEKNDDQAVYQAQLKGWKVAIKSLQNNNKEIFGSKGNLLLSMKKNITRTNWIRSKDKASKKRQCILLMLGVLYMIYGVAILQYVVNHMQNAHKYCNMIDETNFFDNDEFNINSTTLSTSQYNLFQRNPELFFWNKCLYKVYPFTNSIKDNPYNHRCQCRVLVIDWEQTISTEHQRSVYFNLSQPKILSNMLTHWYQLEKFRTYGKSEIAGTTISKAMFIAKHMKAFEWIFAPITCIQEGISQWKKLEYFKLREVTLHHLIPDDFAGLSAMKYLSFTENGLKAIPESICDLTSLQVLEIQWEVSIQFIPYCVSQLVNLEQLTIENCISLEDIPLSVFALQNLVILSLFHNKISLSSLIRYNAPKAMMNDTDDAAAIQWLQNTMNLSPNMEEFYLTLNPICDENITWFPIEFNMSAACYSPCNIDEISNTYQFCPSRLFGDGKCDIMCNNPLCYDDGGDCVQLCFSPLTNCTYDLYSNDVCDEVCNNDYCLSYYDETFKNARIHLQFGPDNGYCLYSNSTLINNNSHTQTCEESNSSYIDIDRKENECKYTWIGDGLCDDLCRTYECKQDGGDCDTGASCTDNYCKYIYDAWLLFTPDWKFNINISYWCNTIYPSGVSIFGFDPLNDTCQENPTLYDWNNDGYVNFREWTYLAWWIGGGWTQKGRQLNCSECIGMQYYNVKHDAKDNNESVIELESINVCNAD